MDSATAIIGIIGCFAALAGSIYNMHRIRVLEKRLAKYEKDGVPICNGENK